jgi:hypothetical protein
MGFGFADRQHHGAGEGVKTGPVFGFGRLQKPAAGRKKRLRGSAVGQDFHPALDAPGVKNAPDFDGIVRQAGRL